jgi:predicted DNA-binding transcriptional regulator AlpA
MGVEILTPSELAQMLRISERTLRKWRAEGRILDPLGLGDAKDARWSAAEVREWVEARCPDAGAWRERKGMALAR